MENIKTVLVEGALMNNNEVIHYGKTLGFISKKQRELIEAGASKLSRGNEIVVSVSKDRDTA